MNYWTLSQKNIWVAAHRGWSTKYPENTMPAFEAAVALGVDQLEFDVHETKDGELVIIHDTTVDRTTDGTGAIADMTYEEILKLDAGIRKGEEFKGLRIPTMRQVMELVKDHPTMTLDVELKVYPTQGEERCWRITDKILAMIDEYGYTDRCVINTFSGRLHEYIRGEYGEKYRQHVYFPLRHNGECTLDPYDYGYCVCMFGDGDIMASQADFDAMAEAAAEAGYIKSEDIARLIAFRNNPSDESWIGGNK